MKQLEYISEMTGKTIKKIEIRNWCSEIELQFTDETTAVILSAMDDDYNMALYLKGKEQ
jgi:hypothetical protein